MKMRLPSMWSPIGLDIGPHHVTAVQIDSLGRVRSYASFRRAEADVDLTESEASRIREVLDRCGFRGLRTAIAAPRSMLRSAILDLPPAASGAPIQHLARMELSRLQKMPQSSFAIGLWELPESTRGSAATQSMAVACPNDAADALCGVLDDAGLEVIAMDTTACALCRALPIDASRTEAILELNQSRSTLIVVHKGVVVFERQLGELTMHSLRARLAKHLRLPLSASAQLLRERGFGTEPDNLALLDAAKAICESFVEEIAQSAAFASSRYRDAAVSRVFLVGSDSSTPHLGSYLSSALECEFVTPRLPELTVVRGPSEERMISGQGVLALGLARWERDQ